MPTLLPQTLLRKHGIARIDLVLVDTEGLDAQIIYLLFEAGISPAEVYFEHIHLDANRQDAVCDFLNRRGYRFARTRTDTFAMTGEDVLA